VTFSLVGRCARTGMFGAIVTSSSPAVAARCAFARAGVGAACSQNVTDPRLGPALLDRLAAGRSAPEALADVVAAVPHVAYRQLTVVDAEGRSAAHTGERTLGTNATAAGRDCQAAGNLLASIDVPAAMVGAYELDPGAHIGDRLLAALEAGAAAGGEEGPVRSCGLVLVRDVGWYVADLRVDWSEAGPIAELRALWDIYEPQLDDYVTRALDPTQAPSYGVPGDE
jgi:uncharacterized Ntn-hydrolase superfamily protein